MKNPQELTDLPQTKTSEQGKISKALQLEEEELEEEELVELVDELHEIVYQLADGGPLNPDASFSTMEDVVDELVATGNAPHVFVKHDDHLGLKSNLSRDFLNSPLSEIEKPYFKGQIEDVIYQANIIMPLAKMEPSEDDLDDIREDEISRGIDHDD